MSPGRFIPLAALLGLAAVAAGAFGAHALERLLEPRQLEWWEKAVRYHAVHVPTLLLVGVLGLLRPAPHPAARPLAAAGWALTAGVLLFSGSLYLLALGGPRWLVWSTPLGGISLLAGWGLLAWAGVRAQSPLPGNDSTPTRSLTKR